MREKREKREKRPGSREHKKHKEGRGALEKKKGAHGQLKNWSMDKQRLSTITLVNYINNDKYALLLCNE